MHIKANMQKQFQKEEFNKFISSIFKFMEHCKVFAQNPFP